MSQAVVVTGLGLLGPWGAGREGLRADLAASRARLGPLPQPGLLETRRGLAPRPRVCWAGRVEPEAVAPWLPPGAARRMSKPSRLAVAAARMALADAGFGTGAEDEGGWRGLAEEAALILSTSYGPSSVSEEMEEQILLAGPEAASPSLFAEAVANAPAAQVARLTGARGANLTVTAREAGPLLALRQAAAEVAAGRSRVALAGVVDELTPLLQGVLDRFGALARSRRAAEPPVARPFDLKRSGFVTGEGAVVMVLEGAEAAARRGRTALASVVAAGAGFDPTAPRTGWGTGHRRLGAALHRTLERAGLGPGAVDLIVSGASGSRAGDRLEALTLRAAWGDLPLPPVVAPKGVTGELGGGQLAAALLAIGGACFGASPGFREPDPELGVLPWAGGPFPRPVRRALLSALAVGGGAAWLVLEVPP
ncbi:MAG TPA: beta-ketoacyl synthase N-terminal-like domain-containing protein [Thermoanaerobaculia bacterium]|nr:beta-ketoacyl synthase N-terminal-like domain-containing protein [Thermoanaerobaculia bacterium]